MTEIFFKSEGHKERFLRVLRLKNRIERGMIDREWGAALYILFSDPILSESASPNIHGGIDFEEILSQRWSSGEQTLIKLANNLFNGCQQSDSLDLVLLDHKNFEVAMQAIRLRRDGCRVEDIR